MIESVVVPSFPIFTFMVDGAPMDFDFADAVVSLKIRAVVNGVP